MTGGQNEFCIVEKNNHVSHVIPFSLVSHVKSQYQDIKIASNNKYGKCLILDNAIQLAEYDEFMYHEFLVQPAMHISKPKRALVLGGGDGCACREMLKHESIEEIVLVDIDRDVVQQCKIHMNDINNGSLDDDKVNIIIGDAIEYVETCNEKFDVIISDITDPDMVGDYFYSEEFVSKCKNVLSDGGVFATQAGMLSYEENIARTIFDKIGKLFKHSVLYSSPYIGSFNSTWGFVVCSDAFGVKECRKVEIKCRIFSEQMHSAMICLANAIKGNKKYDENKYYERSCKEINL